MTVAPIPATPQRSFLAESLAQLPLDAPRTLLLQAPAVAPEILLSHPRLANGEGTERRSGALLEASLLLAQGDEGTSGLGEAIVLRAEGAGRFGSIRAEAKALFARLRHREQSGALSSPARLYGGFSFAPGGAQEHHWQALGDARFFLPRWTYVRRGNEAALRLTLAPGDDGASAHREYAELLRRLRLPLRAPAFHDWSRRPGESRSDYTLRIDAAKDAIASGAMQKVVAARHIVLQANGDRSFVDPMLALRTRYPACARFLFRHQTTAFLGATPERLVRLQDGQVETEALAGTVAAGEGAALMASAKDAEEHRLVIDAIRSGLGEVADLAPPEATPRVRRLPGIVHLRTPIEGRLKDPATHILSLVERLHPTPAVGGVPQSTAIEWLARTEDPRGWYAAPIGSFDGSGNGEFFVALRCGVLLRSDTQHTTAHAYAGGGIVAASDSAAEFAESELKLRPFLGALMGVQAEPPKH